jgi:arginase family enzyme
MPYDNGPDIIRKHLCDMYFWHKGIQVADIGNIRMGATLADTRAALRAVLSELDQQGKIAIVIGGSHDLTMQQYEVFKKAEKMAEAVVTDMYIDLEDAEMINSRSFLLEMLTETPNFISHYSHIAFQSYYTQPRMLETLDKLRFDFFRLGKVKDNIMEMEPVVRSANFFSFDMSSVRYPDAIANIKGSPNGLTGEEACTLTRFAGMAGHLTSLGLFGYNAQADQHEMTAKLMSQMIWYFIDGYLVRQAEAPMHDRNDFLVFNVSFTETDTDTAFYKSKRTNRWWMRLPDGTMIPCTYNDYMTACNNEIPERWLRRQERLL